MDRGAWQATFHRVTKSQIFSEQLSMHTHTCTHTHAHTHTHALIICATDDKASTAIILDTIFLELVLFFLHAE